MGLFKPDNVELECASCKRTPTELGMAFFAEEGQTPDEYVWENEGTLDRLTGLFLCDECYIHWGMPSSPGAGWKATSGNLAALRMVHRDFGTWRPS